MLAKLSIDRSIDRRRGLRVTPGNNGVIKVGASFGPTPLKTPSWPDPRVLLRVKWFGNLNTGDVHYSTFFGATVLREVLNICPYSSLGMDIEY